MRRKNAARSTLIGALRHQKDAILTRLAIFQTVSPGTWVNKGLLAWLLLFLL